MGARTRSRMIVSAVAGATLSLALAEAAAADVLYRVSGTSLFDGRHGAIARFQDKANSVLQACGASERLDPDGRFGRGTRAAIIRLSQCPQILPLLGADDPARAGAISTQLWTTVMGTAAPSVDERAKTLKLTYEATDYGRMEWNFCQSRPLFNPAEGQPVCYSNDRRAYLTWGPNGATAGHGREVQVILQQLDRGAPRLIDDAFGGEAGAVRRMFRLTDGRGSSDLEVYLCGIWMDQNRRAAWRNGFTQLGQHADVRTTFDRLYASASLDGGKIGAFYRAYAQFGLVPTEINYGFFKDRAAHMSVAVQPVREAIAALLASDPNPPRWKVRRAIALAVRPANQRADRLGRDVAFYIDGAGTSLTVEESRAWAGRGQLRASDVGLSDARTVASFEPGPPLATGITEPHALTDDERDRCPVAVLQTRAPPGG
jgi:hypothetical protein